MPTTTVNKYAGIIDSGDVIERFDELCHWRERGCLYDDDLAELEVLEALIIECKASVDNWDYGTLLIRDSYLKTYARDRGHATRELQMNCVPIEFDGITYWARA